jgi:hypothetical protein
MKRNYEALIGKEVRVSAGTKRRGPRDTYTGPYRKKGVVTGADLDIGLTVQDTMEEGARYILCINGPESPLMKAAEKEGRGVFTTARKRGYRRAMHMIHDAIVEGRVVDLDIILCFAYKAGEEPSIHGNASSKSCAFAQ